MLYALTMPVDHPPASQKKLIAVVMKSPLTVPVCAATNLSRSVVIYLDNQTAIDLHQFDKAVQAADLRPGHKHDRQTTA